jgi:hypothetical protein
MYTSTRYYYTNINKRIDSEDVKSKNKNKCIYVKMDKEFLTSIDNHILLNLSCKPSESYEDYIHTHNDILTKVVRHMTSLHINKEDILGKLKKTYKNRFYNIRTLK